MLKNVIVRYATEKSTHVAVSMYSTLAKGGSAYAKQQQHNARPVKKGREKCVRTRTQNVRNSVSYRGALTHLLRTIRTFFQCLYLYSTHTAVCVHY